MADYHLPALWDGWWGYLIKEQTAPVLIGEFGSTLADPKDATWMKSLLSYLGTGTTGASFTYWSWNPNSGDTGGILNDDWTTINQAKQAILEPYLFGGTTGAPPATAPATATATTRPTTTATPTATVQPSATATAGSPSPTATTATPSTGTRACTALVTLQTWSGGYLGTVTVMNNGTTVTPWSIQLEVPAGVRVQNGWNAEVTLSGTTITAAAPTWNPELSTGEEVSVGFVAAGPSSPAPDNVRLDGVPCATQAVSS